MISFRTDISSTKKHTKKHGRWKALIALNICLAVMCAVVFGFSAFAVRANAANYDAEKVKSTEWYTISDDGRTIDIHLDGNLSGYQWKYGLSNDTLRELRHTELTDDQKESDLNYDWSAHFTTDSAVSGDVVITLQYVLNSESGSADTRTIPLHIDKGRMALQ